jgi:hypothetical protein
MKYPIWACTFFFTMTGWASKIHTVPVDLLLPMKISTLISERQSRLAEENKNVIELSSAMFGMDPSSPERKNTELELQQIGRRKSLRSEIDQQLQQKDSQTENQDGLEKGYILLATELLIEHAEQIPFERQFQICLPETISKKPIQDFNQILLQSENVLKKIDFGFSLEFSSDEISLREDSTNAATPTISVNSSKMNCSSLQKKHPRLANEMGKNIKIQSLQQELQEFGENPSTNLRQYCNRPEGLSALEKILKKQVQLWNMSNKNNPHRIQLQVLTDNEESSNSSNPNLRCVKILKIGGNL